MPIHYLKEWEDIINSIPNNTLQYNLKRNSCIFILENAFENIGLLIGPLPFEELIWVSGDLL